MAKSDNKNQNNYKAMELLVLVTDLFAYKSIAILQFTILLIENTCNTLSSIRKISDTVAVLQTLELLTTLN